MSSLRLQRTKVTFNVFDEGERVLLQKYTTYFLPSKEYRSSYNNYETEVIFVIKTVTLYHMDSYRHENRFSFKVDTENLTTIDPFTDTAAILNLLDLRSFIGCQGGIRSEFTHALWAKRELQCTFLRKKAIIITSKHGTTIFFPIKIFF